MVATMAPRTYHARLFKRSALRAQYHRARYEWLIRELRRLEVKSASFIELGCHDAETILYLDKALISIGQYVGFDANWEGGLDAGKARWKDRPEIQLYYCKRPDGIRLSGALKWDIGICFETFEHVWPEDVEPYLAKLSGLIDGYFFVTVPVERGAAFLIKSFFRRIRKDPRVPKIPYTRRDRWNSFRGKLHLVEKDEHKGFDDRAFLKKLQKHFEIVSVSGFFERRVVARTKS